MRGLRRVVIATCVALVPAVNAAAQDTTHTGTLAGIVRGALDSVPVTTAIVTLDSGASASTDSAGAFVFRGIRAGAHRVSVRRVGFEPATADAVVAADRTDHIAMYLRPVAQPLTAVQVAGQRIEVPSRLVSVAQRVERNHGTLFTARDIDPEDRTRNVLQRLPGVNVNDRSVTFARCQDSGTLPGIFGGFGHNAPRVQVYIDGQRVTAGEVGSIVDGVNPASIELMEVYTGMGRIPAEFASDACAVIAIWTKAY